MSRVVVLRDFAASPDHNHTRMYKKGEVHEVGSSLMPEGLVKALESQYVPSGSLVGVVSLAELEGKQSEPCIKVENGNVSEEAKKANREAHLQLYGSESSIVLPW